MELLSYQSKAYKVAGFYRMFDSSESSAVLGEPFVRAVEVDEVTKEKKVTTLFSSIYSRELGLNSDFLGDLSQDHLPSRVIPTMIRWYRTNGSSDVLCENFDVNARRILKSLNLDPDQFIVVRLRLGYVVLLQQYNGLMSVFDKLSATSAYNYVRDYLLKGNEIRLLRSAFAEAKRIADLMHGSIDQNQKDVLSKDDIVVLFDKEFHEQRQKNLEKSSSSGNIKPPVTRVATVYEQHEVTLFGDYKQFGRENNVDLMTLHTQIVEQAMKQGGLVSFFFEGKEFKIPKIPLCLWVAELSALLRKRLSSTGDIMKYDSYTWKVISPESIKTSGDSCIHSDWWIGAGIPLNAYTEKQSHYKDFNEVLFGFALEQVQKVDLNNLVVLAGHDLPEIEGRVVVHPLSLDEFNEGDIIVLPYGGVEFDAYMKKACRNGKGAVILEVINRVSHLNKVAKEYNAKGHPIRLLGLPSISSMLQRGQRYKLSTKNQKMSYVKVVSEKLI